MSKNIFRHGLVLCAALLCNSVVSADSLDQMISPITNPVNFEDPRINTEARPIYMYHKIADDFITQGGNVRLYALQLRFAVTDDLAIIATKDGYVDFNPDSTLNDESGFANLAGGVKYSFYKTDSFIATGGLRYEAPTGNRDVFQGNGDGFINPFLSIGATNCDFNFIAGTGLRQAIDGADSTFYDADLHLDYKVGNFYPTVEFNMVHVLDAGNRLGIADEGQDLISFGSSASDGKTIVTAGVGARYRVSNAVDLGLAYQFPLTNGAGSNITDWRITADLIYSFSLV